MLIGWKNGPSMIIMRGMGSQVSRSFDVATAWRQCWMVVAFAGSSLGPMKNENMNPVVSFNATEK